MAIDNRLQVFNEEGQSVDYDILASDVKFLPDGKDLPTKLAEMEQEIGQGGYTPPAGGIPKTDLAPSVQTSLGLADTALQASDKSELQTAITSLQNALNTLIGSGNVQGAIDTFNEVTAFLNGIDSSDTLAAKLALKANDNAVVKSVTINGELKTPQSGNVSFDVQAGETVVINSDGANIVDSHTNPSILVAPSARQMYMAYNNIATLFRKVNDLYDKLAGIAFTDGKPASWKEYADWSSVTIPTHTITLGTMTNVTASLNDTPISGSTSATEGEVTILLAPTSNNYMGSISVKDASNNDVAFTQTDVAGGTEITFILSGNVTISASASSGIEVNVSGTGITSYTTGVQPNTAAQLTIALPEHHTWGTVTVSYGGTDITSQCTISQANNADKVITLPNNLSDMSKSISIVANTVEDAHVTLAISSSNFVVKQGNTQLSNGSKVYNGSAAQTLTIEPASGYKFSTLPSADQGTMTNNGPYEASSLVIGTSDEGTLTITAAATELNQSCQITLPATGNGIASAALTDMNGTAITSPVVEGTGIKIVLTPDTDFTISTISIANLTEGTDYNVTDNNGVKTITIQHVTGNVVVTAAATQPTVLETNLKWFVEPTEQEKAITEGQQFSIDLIPLTNFVAAASQPMSDDGTTQLDTPKSIRAAVQVTMNGTDITSNTGVVTYDETNNKVTVSISNPSGRVVITAAARLTLIRNKYITKYGSAGVNQGVDATGIMATKAVVPVPAFTGYLPVQAVRWQFYNNVDKYNSCMVLYKDGSMIHDSYWSWGANATNGGRTVTDAQSINGMNGVKASFKQGEIDSASNYPGIYVNGTGTDVLSGGWLPVISKDDLLNALHVDS